ncbi:MAG TPA: ABC transporter permease [Planctomycetes bacterium]|nr:ABC transporter permease [Planctomycetota bacterium]
MKKIRLVALREFFENMRTKTFWIGILFFPVVLILSIVIPKLLQDHKDARLYAVLDRSGWLLEAVEERAAFPDMEKLLRVIRDRLRDGSAMKGLPPGLEGQAEAIRDMSDEEISRAASTLTMLHASPEGQKILDDLPEEVAEMVKKSGEQLRRWYSGLSAKEARKFSRSLSRSLYERVDIAPGDETDPEAPFREALNEGRIFAYIVVGKDPIETSQGNKYVSNNLTDDALRNWFARFASEVVREKRIEREGIDEEVIRRIQTPVVFKAVQLTETGEETKVESVDKAMQFIPIAFVYLLWIAIFMISQMLLTNTIEEKSNRTIEVLLSSVSPTELMAGKIVGIALTGLTVVLCWVMFFVLTIKAAPAMNLEPPFDLTPLITYPKYLVSFVVYFLLGYLLYASLLVGIGSVCNSLKEAQNLMMPVSVMLMIPLFTMFPIVQDPNGALARVMTFIPLTTPFAMMNRAAADIPTWEYLVSGVLLLATIALFVWAAGKIFRVGILMTGKPPKLKEIIRWVLSA